MFTNRVVEICSAAALTGAVVAGGAASGVALSSGAALAAPTSCLIRTYYKTAEMTEQVGVRTNCPGMSSSGRTSRYVEVERIEFDQSSGTGGGQATLPCEFLAKGQERCQNVPIRRP